MRQLIRAAAAALGILGAISGQMAFAQFEQTRFGSSAFGLGALTPNTGAFSQDLWEDTDRQTVEDLLSGAPTVYSDPYHLELLRRVTLSPGDGPRGADNALAGRKFLTAAYAGFYSDAASLAELVPGLRSEPTLSKVVAYRELMDGQTDTACSRGANLRDGRTDPFWVKLRFICYVQAGESSAADLTLDLLRRQDVLVGDEEARFMAFRAGAGIEARVPTSIFDWTLMRERQVTLSPDMVATSPLGYIAAVARNTNYSIAVREKALIKAVSSRAIGVSEAQSLLDTMPTSSLAGDLISVAAQTRGTLEQYDAIAAALGNAQGNWEEFTARALLLSSHLTTADPVTGYAPLAGRIALAAMVTGQTPVVEKWILALASDESDANSAARASELLDAFVLIDPGAARRISGYLGVELGVPDVYPFNGNAVETSVPLSTFVRAGLHAAEAGSEGPAALLYLMSLGVVASEENQPIRDAVSNWAREHADLDWIDRQAVFNEAAVAYLTNSDAGARIVDGKPLPRVKPE